MRHEPEPLGRQHRPLGGRKGHDHDDDERYGRRTGQQTQQDERAADEQRLEWMEAGDHRAIVDSMDDYMPHNPEGDFGHYLMMLGANPHESNGSPASRCVHPS